MWTQWLYSYRWKRIILLVSSIVIISGAQSRADDQGRYFVKKRYSPHPLPEFASARAHLPSPIFDERPVYVECYWKAWEIAFKNFHEPDSGSGFVSQFMDAAFNQNIFLWDTCFLTMFCNYGHPYVPGIRSLDNFYAKQHADGEICREINRTTGADFEPWRNVEGEALFSRWGYDWESGMRKVVAPYRGRPPPKSAPVLTLDALNHPILAWAEIESFHFTGDKKRLEQVWQPLVRYFEALRTYLRQGNGLYMTDSASMDNSTRNRHLAGGGIGVDISSEMVLFARNLAEMGEILGKEREAKRFLAAAERLTGLIREKLWDTEKSFFFDLTRDDKRVPVKTVAGFWPLIAGVASSDQARALVAHLRNESTFGTLHRVPTLAADETGFHAETGRYWRGAVWAPTNCMVVRGLERYGFPEEAREIALNHLRHVVAVFEKTGTIWENYAPCKATPGKPAKRDFVGWSGIAPIVFFLEYAIGLKADGITKTLTWDIRTPRRVGVKRFWFGGRTVSLVCEAARAGEARRVQISADAPCRLILRGSGREKSIDVPKTQALELSF